MVIRFAYSDPPSIYASVTHHQPHFCRRANTDRFLLLCRRQFQFRHLIFLLCLQKLPLCAVLDFIPTAFNQLGQQSNQSQLHRKPNYSSIGLTKLSQEKRYNQHLRAEPFGSPGDCPRELAQVSSPILLFHSPSLVKADQHLKTFERTFQPRATKNYQKLLRYHLQQ